MNDLSPPGEALSAAQPLAAGLPLGEARPGVRGRILAVSAGQGPDGQELERRLLEFGFVEGAEVCVLHEGLVGGDPIAVRLDDMRVALRRADANLIAIAVEAGDAAVEAK